ncbi:MAG: hypothetical protein ABH860_05945 [bacterium]
MPHGNPRSLDSKTDNELFDKALKIMENSYAIYTNEPQGAAILTSTGKIFAAPRIEDPSFPPSDLIEAALNMAFSQGEIYIEKILLITVINPKTDPKKIDAKIRPAGKSLQKLYEVSLIGNLDFEVIWVNKTPENIWAAKISELLPCPFSPEHFFDKPDKMEEFKSEMEKFRRKMEEIRKRIINQNEQETIK